MHRIFLLSPARAGGKRAALLTNPRASFALAQALQRGDARPLGEIFGFLSGLYFRGKRAYAETFADPPAGETGAWVITPNRGLVPLDAPTTLEELRQFGAVPIDEADERYRGPLLKTGRRLARQEECEFVLLGSIGTGKYVNVLLECFGGRLRFPREFVGRGDMSRGGLLLRCVRDRRELEYRPVEGAVLRGKRPPRLEPASWKGTRLDLRAD
ncbi:hypothetical protein DB347_12300 [Opitutaceae bacterium EW11]|nr:hypothetical protein DB347_12300 [Opitutaceae bacterium EW11]